MSELLQDLNHVQNYSKPQNFAVKINSTTYYSDDGVKKLKEKIHPFNKGPVLSAVPTNNLRTWGPILLRFTSIANYNINRKLFTGIGGGHVI